MGLPNNSTTGVEPYKPLFRTDPGLVPKLLDALRCIDTQRLSIPGERSLTALNLIRITEALKHIAP
jgi:hypothetical protein